MKKKALISFLTGICIAVSVAAGFAETKRTLSQTIIRLHVRANSNSPKDQELKLKVRNRVLEECDVLLDGAKSREDVYNIIGSNLDSLAECAQKEVRCNGYNYPVNVTLGKSDFPAKAYGDIYLPGGTYEALVVNIGEAKGDNWWCVVFPQLCLADGTVSREGKEELEESLGSNTYDMVSDSKPKIKFKMYELWQDIMK